MKKISILIPFLNEEKFIGELLLKIISLDLKSIGYEKQVILINDGSTDKSIEIVNNIILEHKENIEFLVINNKKNSGKGFSIKQGISKSTGDIIIIQDADLEYNPNDYFEMIKKLEEEKLDFIYGSRTRGYFKEGFKYSYISFFLGGVILSILTSILSFKIVTDEPTCYKMYRKELKKYLLLPKENGFEWEPASTMILCRKGFTYGETAIDYFPRKESEGKKINWVDGLIAIKILFKWRFKRIKD